MIKFWARGKMKAIKKNKFYEQENLQLDITKAKKKLGWFPTYNIKHSVRITTAWYFQIFKKRKNPLEVTNEQIESYMNENNWT